MSRSWSFVVGLVGLLVWLVGGMILEAFHGFKVAFYLEDILRRELWILAHAHGTLFSVIALMIPSLIERTGASAARARTIDRAFAIGAAVMPWGFLIGGVTHTEADPNLAIVLVPLGGLIAAYALILLTLTYLGNRPGE